MKVKSRSDYMSLPTTFGKVFFDFFGAGDRNTCSIIAASDFTL